MVLTGRKVYEQRVLISRANRPSRSAALFGLTINHTLIRDSFLTIQFQLSHRLNGVPPQGISGVIALETTRPIQLLAEHLWAVEPVCSARSSEWVADRPCYGFLAEATLFPLYVSHAKLNNNSVVVIIKSCV